MRHCSSETSAFRAKQLLYLLSGIFIILAPSIDLGFVLASQYCGGVEFPKSAILPWVFAADNWIRGQQV